MPICPSKLLLSTRTVLAPIFFVRFILNLSLIQGVRGSAPDRRSPYSLRHGLPSAVHVGQACHQFSSEYSGTLMSTQIDVWDPFEEKEKSLYDQTDGKLFGQHPRKPVLISCLFSSGFSGFQFIFPFIINSKNESQFSGFYTQGSSQFPQHLFVTLTHHF